jgi:hypothetical protein
MPVVSGTAKALVTVLAGACLLWGCGGGTVDGGARPTPTCASGDRPARFSPPSFKGINYGVPDTASGAWVGTSWLRSGTGQDDNWDKVRPALEADLAFIEANHLGQTLRIFVGLDQAMRWDARTGFQGFYGEVLDNFQTTLRMVAAHHLRAIVVVYDHEVTTTRGDFRVQALDGTHPAMRQSYLTALYEFLRRFGTDPAVLGWDLFNEAYNSLGKDGGLPPPDQAAPGEAASPGYANETILAWLRDLHAIAVCAAPGAWYTASDSTELVGRFPKTDPYQGAVDFYDLHIYEDDPSIPDLRALKLPAILGEVGPAPDHLSDQSRATTALRLALDRGRKQGAAAVLAHQDGGILYHRSNLTQTGRLLASTP